MYIKLTWRTLDDRRQERPSSASHDGLTESKGLYLIVHKRRVLGMIQSGPQQGIIQWLDELFELWIGMRSNFEIRIYSECQTS